jgi:hypothetical protein
LSCVTADDGASFLHINTDHMVVGSSQRLVFSARFLQNTTGNTARLYQSALPGNLTTLVFPLVDDGLYSHRDEVAGDLVYSNTLTIQFDTVGTVYYAAVAGSGSDQPLVAMINVVAAPSQIQRDAGLTVARDLQAQLSREGTPSLGALNNIRDALLDRHSIQPSDIIVSKRSVRWKTAEGLRFMVQAFVAGERSGGRGRRLLGKDAALGKPYHAAAIQQRPATAAAAMSGKWLWRGICC